ncbi:MAG TPA: hypothetical protein VM305_01515 [Candidatus Limnocylindrales bacterium]|nr:hypothetical protein [Candidatus Limnocylindrales bacterium]
MRDFAARLQPEDLVIGAVVMLAALVNPGGWGEGPLHPWSENPLSALFSLVAAGGAIVAVATRVPGEARFDPGPSSADARAWMIGPFIGGVAFVGGTSLERLGLPGGGLLIFLALAAAVASFVLGDRLPVMSRPARRMLVTPFVVMAAVLFHDPASLFSEGLAGSTELLSWLLAPENLVLTLYVLAIIGFAGWIFYAMLIFVPRELADPGGSTRSWAVRFAFFYVTLVAAMFVGATVPVLTP